MTPSELQQLRADAVTNFVSAILSTGGPVIETVVESLGYKPLVKHSIVIADYMIEKLLESDSEFIEKLVNKGLIEDNSSNK